MAGSGSGFEKIMDANSVCPERLDPDPVCPERLDPDPVNIRLDPKSCCTFLSTSRSSIAPYISQSGRIKDHRPEGEGLACIHLVVLLDEDLVVAPDEAWPGPVVLLLLPTTNPLTVPLEDALVKPKRGNPQLRELLDQDYSMMSHSLG